MKSDFNKVVAVIKSCKTCSQNIVAYSYLQQYLKQRQLAVKRLVETHSSWYVAKSLSMQKKIDQDSEILHYLLDKNLFEIIDIARGQCK